MSNGKAPWQPPAQPSRLAGKWDLSASGMMEEADMLHLSFMLVGMWVAAQPENPPYQMPQPRGWGKESITLPPPFAPKMTWKGAEELRFAPAWLKADSDTFFSYTLLFWLPADQKVDKGTVEKELLTYYQGLATAILRRKQQEADVSAFAVTLKESSADKRVSGEAVSAYVGELKWTEPFTTGKPQTLHLDVHTWHCDKHKHHCVLICASPQPPMAAVWKSLREIRVGVTCP